MTYDEIRAELLALRNDPTAREITHLKRAAELVGKLEALGLSPRKLGLSLRHLGLNPRAVTRGRR